MKKRFMLILLAVSVVLFAFINAPVSAEDGVFSAVTDDGVTLKMRRYRPTTDSSYNRNGQPVIIIPGIMCGLDAYCSRTPSERANAYAGMELPEPVADWAIGDEYIQKDPMIYYSLAYYLWQKGFDPWLPNYRGTGRGDYESGMRTALTTLDIWGVMDVPAWVKKVTEVTGKKPYIGGHSTGGFVCYVYLQGAYMDLAELEEGYENGYLPHVKCDPALAVQRNSQVKGFIAIDPGCSPPLPGFLDLQPLWLILSAPVYLDIDRLIDQVVNPYITSKAILTVTINTLFGLIEELDDTLSPYIDLFGYFDFWHVKNTVANVEDYFCRYAATSTYMRGVSGWVNNGLRKRIREHWMNGEENKYQIICPAVDSENDGYYYYDEHMFNVTAPTIALLSESSSLVDSQDVIEHLMQAKTHHAYDYYYEIPGTAHMDIVCGVTAPTIMFPLIGAWLDRVEGTATATIPAQENTVTETDTENDGKDDSIVDTTEDDLSATEENIEDTTSDDSIFGCGSPANASTIKNTGDMVFSGIINIICMMIFPFSMVMLLRFRRRRK